jgi:hypothetical protein
MRFPAQTITSYSRIFTIASDLREDFYCRVIPIPRLDLAVAIYYTNEALIKCLNNHLISLAATDRCEMLLSNFFWTSTMGLSLMRQKAFAPSGFKKHLHEPKSKTQLIRELFVWLDLPQTH